MTSLSPSIVGSTPSYTEQQPAESLIPVVSHVISGLLTAHAQQTRPAPIHAERLTASWRRWVGDAGRCGCCCWYLGTICWSSTRLAHHMPTRPSASGISCNSRTEQEPLTSPSNRLRTTVSFARIISGTTAMHVRFTSLYLKLLLAKKHIMN